MKTSDASVQVNVYIPFVGPNSIFVSPSLGEKGEGKTTYKPLHYKGTLIHRIVKGFIVQGGDFENGIVPSLTFHIVLDLLFLVAPPTFMQVTVVVENQYMEDSSKVFIYEGETEIKPIFASNLRSRIRVY